MDGTTARFYFYEKTMPRVSIPKALTEGLNWKHKDDLRVVIKTVDGKLGLFIYKED